MDQNDRISVAKAELLKDVNKFIEFCFTDDQGNPIKQSHIHKVLQESIDKYDRLVVLMPRNFGKTSQILFRVIYEIAKNRNIKIKIVCASEAFAKQRVMSIRAQILGNKKLKYLFPDLVESDVYGEFSKFSLIVKRSSLDKDPTVEAQGILSTGVGGRADFLFFDDVVSYRNSIYNPSMQSSVIESFQNVWCPLLNPGGKIVYVATPFTSTDLTARLRQSKLYHVLEFPVGPNFESPWPERWSREQLMRIYQEIGKAAFDRNYRLIPYTSTGIFSIEQIQKICVRVKDAFDTYVIGVDLGVGEEGESYTAATVVAVSKTKRAVIDVFRDKVEARDFLNILAALNDTYKPIAIGIEVNNFERYMLQLIEAAGLTNLPIVPVNTEGPSNIGTLARILSIEIDRGLWEINIDDHPFDCLCSLCHLRRELMSYPYGGSNDCVASLCIAYKVIRDICTDGVGAKFDTLL